MKAHSSSYYFYLIINPIHTFTEIEIVCRGRFGNLGMTPKGNDVKYGMHPS